MNKILTHNYKSICPFAASRTPHTPCLLSCVCPFVGASHNLHCVSFRLSTHLFYFFAKKVHSDSCVKQVMELLACPATYITALLSPQISVTRASRKSDIPLSVLLSVFSHYVHQSFTMSSSHSLSGGSLMFLSGLWSTVIHWCYVFGFVPLVHTLTSEYRPM